MAEHIGTVQSALRVQAPTDPLAQLRDALAPLHNTARRRVGRHCPAGRRRRRPGPDRARRRPEGQEIKIAVPTDFPPYGFVGTDLKPQGLDVDMANYIAAKLGVKVELVPVTSANRIPYLQTRKADLVISTLGKNPEREKVIDFTVAYSPFFIAVFAPKT
jgi:ABC-type amino acid transport substrate-binding protein